jgi:hypothetical protein
MIAQRDAAMEEIARHTTDIARWEQEIAGHQARVLELNALLAQHRLVLDRDVQGHPVAEADLARAREVVETTPLDIVRVEAAITAARTLIAQAQKRNAQLALLVGEPVAR